MLELNACPIIQINLRHADGRPVVGEHIWMHQMTDKENFAPDTITNEDGCCVWALDPGLYELYLPNRTVDPLPILVLEGGGLAVPGMLVDKDRTIYCLTLEENQLAFDGTPGEPSPTPVRFLKRTSFELMMPSLEPWARDRPDLVTVGEESSSHGPDVKQTEDNYPRPAVYNPFIQERTVWILQRPAHWPDEPAKAPSDPPVFFLKSLNL